MRQSKQVTTEIRNSKKEQNSTSTVSCCEVYHTFPPNAILFESFCQHFLLPLISNRHSLNNFKKTLANEITYVKMDLVESIACCD